MPNNQLSQVMDRHGDAVYRLALCRLQNFSDAEDVFQETFLRFLQETDTESWSDEHIKAWLLRVAIHKCVDIGRRRKTHGWVPLEEIRSIAAQDTTEYTELWDAVNQLPKKQRTIFHLYYAEGYKTDEIAGLMNILPSTVRVNLNRARNTLRKELTSYETLP